MLPIRIAHIGNRHLFAGARGMNKLIVTQIDPNVGDLGMVNGEKDQIPGSQGCTAYRAGVDKLLFGGTW